MAGGGGGGGGGGGFSQPPAAIATATKTMVQTGFVCFINAFPVPSARFPETTPSCVGQDDRCIDYYKGQAIDLTLRFMVYATYRQQAPSRRCRMPRKRDEDLLREVGRRVAQIRRVRGWTQEALAGAVGIEPVTLSRLETGDRTWRAAIRHGTLPPDPAMARPVWVAPSMIAALVLSPSCRMTLTIQYVQPTRQQASGAVIVLRYSIPKPLISRPRFVSWAGGMRVQ